MIAASEVLGPHSQPDPDEDADHSHGDVRAAAPSRESAAHGGYFFAVWALGQCVKPQLHPEECVAAVPTHHTHTLGLDGQGRLTGLFLRNDHHWAQVDDASAVGPWASYPPRRVFAD